MTNSLGTRRTLQGEYDQRSMIHVINIFDHIPKVMVAMLFSSVDK